MVSKMDGGGGIVWELKLREKKIELLLQIML